MLNAIKHLYWSLDLLLFFRREINKNIFQENPITYIELYQWVRLYGKSKVISDLKEIWDRHNEYDISTL